MRVAHIYASNGKRNSGDFMLGIAAKEYFKKHYHNQEIKYTDFDCRSPQLYTMQNINKLNTFDAIIVGPGGLILPDSAPNMVSGWQWIISKDAINKITKPIYVLSIGYNLFYTQTIPASKLRIFKENIETLIEKSTHFSMRHTYDVMQLQKIIDKKYHDQIKFEFCPTIWYSREKWGTMNKGTYIAFEIKDDRPGMRYYKIGKDRFYKQLLQIIKQLPNACYLSHDGSMSFYKYLQSNGVNIPVLNNAVANESKIKNNYAQIKTLVCTAGHSQMIADAVGIKTVSLVTHPKLYAYCIDTQNDNYILVNETPNFVDNLQNLLQE